MDSITHVVLGMAEGELIAGKKLGKKAMLWGAIANSVPDIDVLFTPFLSSDQGLLVHRGITHSILFAFLFSLAAAWFFSHRNSKLDFTGWLALWGCGMFSHILLDSFTNYGTGWFEPFSHTRVIINNIFVADPFYTSPLTVSAIALLLIKKYEPSRTKWATGGLILSLVYLGYTFFNKVSIDAVAEKNFTHQKMEVKRYMTAPTPLNNFLWYVLAQSDDGFYTGLYSVFDKDDSISFHFIPQNEQLVSPISSDEKVKRLIRFTQGWYCATLDSDQNVTLNDLRFGTMGFAGDEEKYVFSYSLAPDSSNGFLVHSSRFRSIPANAFGKLIERIEGK
ncbi:MAG TPA: metal-dependent hydrolase [Bacteroidetes bacterium]|nr:metal-dependent hydrolase [Bacteroidota bacterium]